jgi:LPS-assembly protein
MKNLIRPMIITVVLMAVAAGHAGAETAPLAAGSVAVTADNISRDEEKDVMHARGNVLVKWGGYTLLSDSVIVRQEENEALAEGKVKIRSQGLEFTSDRIKLNYVTQTGEADNGFLFFKQHNFRIWGDHIVKTGPVDYRLERGTFTTCDGDSPSWRFTATDLDVKVDDYATGKNALFYVGNMPLFYTPYIVFPVMRERQSGFLFPRFGNSTKKGLNLDIPYYWAISPSQEITLDLDAQTKRGIGIGFDYRYLRSQESSGQVKGYLIYDTQKDWVRGDLTVKQQEFFSPSLALTADLHLSLDRDFYRDYGEVNGDYNRQLLDSTIFLTKNWSRSSLAVEGRFVDDLDSTTNRDTMQKLPAITFTHTRSPIGTTPFYFGLDSSFVDFYRNEGVRGQRLDLHPTVAFYRTLSPGIDVSVWGGYRQRLYNAYGSGAAGGDTNIFNFPWSYFYPPPPDKDTLNYRGRGFQADGLFDGGASLALPAEKVYGLGGSGLLSVRHTIIPELRYTLVQEKNQERLPFFDNNDRVLGQQMLVLSLTNFVTGKYADPSVSPTYRDMLYFRLSEGYQLSGNRRDELTQVDEGRRFTDIRIEARYSLAKNITANLDSRYNPNMNRFSTASFRLDMDDGKGDLAGLGYQFAREQAQFLEGKVTDRGRVQYLEGKVALALIKPFVFRYTGRYSFEKGDFLESDYLLEYKQQCWSVILAYQDRLGNKQLMLSFTLAGVGSVGPLRTF